MRHMPFKIGQNLILASVLYVCVYVIKIVHAALCIICLCLSMPILISPEHWAYCTFDSSAPSLK